MQPDHPDLTPPADHEAGRSTGASDRRGINRSADPERHQNGSTEDAKRLSALAFESTSEGVVITDSACRIVMVNPAFERITGYTQAEAAGRTCAFLQGPETDAPTVVAIREALENQREFSGEILNYCKDGSLYWNDLSISPVRGADGRVTHFIGITRDITLRKHAEAALSNSEARYRDAIEATGGYVLDIDTQHRYVFVSARAEQLLGYASHEILGRTPANFMPPGERERVNAWLERNLSPDGSIQGLEHRIVTKSGKLLWLQVSRIPLHDAQGKLIGYRGTAFDITERKQAEAAQLESEARYRDAAEAAGGYICDLGIDFRYTYVSEAAERMLGYTSEEMLGRTPAAFMPPGEIDRVNACFADYKRADGSLHGLEYRVVTKSGEISWMQTSRIPLLDPHGNVTGYRGTSFDITARKQAEASQAELETRLRESQKMQAIGTLAGGIAHDFNNIIAAILGNVTLARLDAGPSSPAHESLNEIHKSASRARDLVKQILAFSKRQHTHFQPLPLDTVIVETVNMLRATLPARVAIEVQCDQAVPDVAIDKSQIQQVLINLATNAVQAMGGRSGHIRMVLDATVPDEAAFKRHPSLREFCSKHPDSKVRLTVSDDGPGIPPDICLRVFDPFFTTKPVGEGTGLGLSVAHGIVQGHQGVIVVDSEPGAGTQFTICLPGCPAEHEKASTPPLRRAHSEPEPAAPQTPRPGTPSPAAEGGPHILYLDDDEALVSLVKRLLERRGYRISAHHDQNAALEQVGANPAGIDLVLSDYNMPGMSGLDVARAVREIRPDLPVAITSGFIDETLSEQAADVGISGLIFKADSVDAFCKAIAALLPARSA